jgi:hypothetical protein
VIIPEGVISAVQFGVFTSGEIRKLAAVEVSNTSINTRSVVKSLGVNDAHLGTTTRSMLCSTCANTEEFCPGHSGYVKLNRVSCTEKGFDERALCCVYIAEVELRWIIRRQRSANAVAKRSFIFACCVLTLGTVRCLELDFIITWIFFFRIFGESSLERLGGAFSLFIVLPKKKKKKKGGQYLLLNGMRCPYILVFFFNSSLVPGVIKFSWLVHKSNAEYPDDPISVFPQISTFRDFPPFPIKQISLGRACAESGPGQIW